MTAFKPSPVTWVFSAASRRSGARYQSGVCAHHGSGKGPASQEQLGAVGRIVHSLVCRKKNEKAPYNSFIFKNQHFRATLSNLDYTLEPSVASPPQIRIYLGLGEPGQEWEQWKISLGDHKHCCGRCVTHPRTVLWDRSCRSQGKKSCSPQQLLGSAPDYKPLARSSSRQRSFGIRKILVQISPLPLNSPWGSEQITWADLWFHLAQIKNNLYSL